MLGLDCPTKYSGNGLHRAGNVWLHEGLQASKVPAIEIRIIASLLRGTSRSDETSHGVPRSVGLANGSPTLIADRRHDSCCGPSLSPARFASSLLWGQATTVSLSACSGPATVACGTTNLSWQARCHRTSGRFRRTRLALSGELSGNAPNACAASDRSRRAVTDLLHLSAVSPHRTLTSQCGNLDSDVTPSVGGACPGSWPPRRARSNVLAAPVSSAARHHESVRRR
jgi:hypothetical protein